MSTDLQEMADPRPSGWYLHNGTPEERAAAWSELLKGKIPVVDSERITKENEAVGTPP
jgi:hypothetical protein